METRHGTKGVNQIQLHLNPPSPFPPPLLVHQQEIWPVPPPCPRHSGSLLSGCTAALAAAAASLYPCFLSVLRNKACSVKITKINSFPHTPVAHAEVFWDFGWLWS
ncbi:hypothetical protein E2C01_012428 [Portunus trituberculatus]|uniref:Uncharacterized protein n=1 Tax=Portunus trituberculatus TaxID=210409 RepID=A0A5B7DE30_PORTR|nr:hypothetical protein [Portunus trituberculatus]